MWSVDSHVKVDTAQGRTEVQKYISTDRATMFLISNGNWATGGSVWGGAGRGRAKYSQADNRNSPTCQDAFPSWSRLVLQCWCLQFWQINAHWQNKTNWPQRDGWKEATLCSCSDGAEWRRISGTKVALKCSRANIIIIPPRNGRQRWRSE